MAKPKKAHPGLYKKNEDYLFCMGLAKIAEGDAKLAAAMDYSHRVTDIFKARAHQWRDAARRHGEAYLERRHGQ
ncbi:MAG: hypothetical protein ABJ079_08160 [Marinomonas sp.]